MMRFLSLLALLPAVLGNPLNARSTACNNSPDLCDKSYGDITHLGAHDSPFLSDSSTSFSKFGDQYYDTTTQLSGGVRLVTAQVHKSNSEWRLCHTDCKYMDAGTLSTWLKEIKAWMDKNPNEVITIILVNSDGASAADLGGEFKKSGLDKLAYQPSSLTAAPKSWPTLNKMIEDKTRVVVFVPSLTTSNDYPYLMNEWDFVWETAYEATSPSNFSCEPERPSSMKGQTASVSASNQLPLMNHFLYSNDLEILKIQYPNASYVATTNAASGGVGNLGSTASKCQKAWGRQPTFILVDFFNRGPAIDTVDSLNNVTSPVGRTSISTAPASSDASTIDGVFKGLVQLANSAKSGSSPTMGNWVWVGGNWGSILGGGLAL